MISLESSYVCNQDVQWSIELAVKVIHSSFAAQQQSGNVQIGKLADIVRVEVINWCLCVQSQVQQRLPTTQPRIHLHKNSDGVLNIHQFLGSNETSVPFQYLCDNCDEIEACYHVQFEIHLKINEIRTHKVKEVFWRAHPREERKERERDHSRLFHCQCQWQTSSSVRRLHSSPRYTPSGQRASVQRAEDKDRINCNKYRLRHAVLFLQLTLLMLNLKFT